MTEQYFPVVIFIMLYKVVLNFTSVNEILNWQKNSELENLLSNTFLWCCLLCCARWF